MFDFFNDIKLELDGRIDKEAVEKEKRDKRQQKYENKFIFSVRTKIIIFIVGILYLIMTGGILYFGISSKTLKLYTLVRYIFLYLIDIAGLICLAIKNKKTQIAALVLMLMFILLQYFTTILM